MVPLTKTSNWHFEEENNCAKSLFFSFVRKVVLSLFQSILKLFKVHKVFTPFLTYCDTWNFATFFNIYSTLQYFFHNKTILFCSNGSSVCKKMLVSPYAYLILDCWPNPGLKSHGIWIYKSLMYQENR